MSTEKQKVRVDGVYSSWQELLYGVLQGSTLGPFSFNIFLDGTDIATKADDTRPYNTNLTQDVVANKSEESYSIFLKWFNNNYMKENSHKRHL